MCNVSEVINSTHCAGNVMVSTLFEYGDHDLGKGIRKLVGESYKHGFVDGYSDGQQIGFVGGVLGSIVVYCGVKLTAKGIEYLTTKIETRNKKNKKEDNKNAEV